MRYGILTACMKPRGVGRGPCGRTGRELIMIRKIAFAVFALALMAYSGAARAYEAYIDDDSGIVVSRGQAARGSGESYENARKRAVDDARNNLVLMLERQYLDLDALTVGQYLSAHPDKRPVMDRYLNTATVFSENEDAGAVTVTLVLPYYGADGYRAMMAEMQGKEPPAAPGPDEAMSDEIRETLEDRYVSQPPESLGEPFNIALLPFDNESGYTAVDLNGLFTDRLRDMFRRDHRFTMLSAGQSLDALTENGLTMDDIRDSAVTDVVPMQGVNGLIAGSIVTYAPLIKKHGLGGTGYLEMTFTIEVELKILDAATGRWVAFQTVPVTVSERTFTLKSADDAERFIAMDKPQILDGMAGQTFQKSLDAVDMQVRAAFPIEGYVLKVISDWVYINLRKVHGIKEGDVLTVYRVGELLTDPITGKTIDRIRDRIGTVRVIEVKDTYSQCKAEDLFGSKIMPGDVVLLK